MSSSWRSWSSDCPCERLQSSLECSTHTDRVTLRSKDDVFVEDYVESRFVVVCREAYDVVFFSLHVCVTLQVSLERALTL